VGAEWARVSADPTQLEQVLLNLAVNARDAMEKGGVLTMRTGEVLLTEPLHGSTTLLPGRYLTLAVQDSGCGMDAETQARIFEPFFTTKGPGKGTGLGLATVYGIVQQSGGAIFVDSQPGEGTTFTVYLPNAELPLDVAAPPQLTFQKLEQRQTVLVVEDEEIVRELVCAVLSEDGFDVLSAACGRDALAIAHEFHGEIALLVSDVVMPQMTGPECARELLLTRPNTKVLFVSGYSEADISEDGVLSLGVNLLPKPFTPNVLSERVRQALAAAPAA
jgi:CheY-like chemotaxis protein